MKQWLKQFQNLPCTVAYIWAFPTMTNILDSKTKKIFFHTFLDVGDPAVNLYSSEDWGDGVNFQGSFPITLHPHLRCW